MNASSQRAALVLVFIGIALAVAGSVLAFTTGAAVWRYAPAVGCFVQFIGWVLYGRRARRDGGAT